MDEPCFLSLNTFSPVFLLASTNASLYDAFLPLEPFIIEQPMQIHIPPVADTKGSVCELSLRYSSSALLFLFQLNCFENLSRNRLELAFPQLYVYVQGGPKRGHRLVTIILSNLNRFTIFFTGRFLGKFAVKRILKVSLHMLLHYLVKH